MNEPRFKVGDRVRVKPGLPDSTGKRLAGRIGTVAMAVDTHKPTYEVDMGEEYTWLFGEDELEPADANA